MPDPRLPLAVGIETRDGTLTKDSMMSNCFKEEAKGRVYAVKRPGLSVVQSNPVALAQGGFAMVGASYTISGNVLYQVGGGLTFAVPAAADVEPFDIIYIRVDISTELVVLKTTIGLWTFDGAAVTKVVDPDYPQVTVRGIALIDGTYYVMEPDGTIHGSNLDDVTNWSALEFAQTDQTLGNGVRIFRHLNYVLAMCEFGIQGWFDNANPPPGVPISPAGNVSFLVGCASGASLASVSDHTVFMSKTKERGRSITMLEGLSLVPISHPFVDKILNRSTLAGLQCFAVKTTGQSFYVLNLPDLDLTLACDLTTKEWSVWSTTTAGIEGVFQYAFYLSNGVKDLLQHSTNGTVVSVDPTVYLDPEGSISARICTPVFDGMTNMKKFFSVLNLIGDTVAATVAVRYSDDDYQTWSAYRDVDMSSDRKQQRNLGSARHRAFELLHTANTPLRLEVMELEVNAGNS